MSLFRLAELLTALTAIFWQFFFYTCGAVERQQGINLAISGSSKSQLAAGKSSRSRLAAGGSSKSRLVNHRCIGTIIRSVNRWRISAISIIIAGIVALSVYQWYIAVRY